MQPPINADERRYFPTGDPIDRAFHLRESAFIRGYIRFDFAALTAVYLLRLMFDFSF